jgi:hypothetical protein
MATKILTLKTVAAAILAITLTAGAASWAYAGSCTTTCYNIGNQRVCNTNCW